MCCRHKNQLQEAEKERLREQKAVKAAAHKAATLKAADDKAADKAAAGWDTLLLIISVGLHILVLA